MFMVIENDDIHSFWSRWLIPPRSIGSTQGPLQPGPPHLSAPTALGISVASKLLKALESKPWIVNPPVKVRILGSELSKNSVINGWTSILGNFPMMGWILSVCQFLNGLSSCQFPNPATKQPRVGKSPLMVQKKKLRQTPLVTAKSLLMLKPCYSN